MRKIIIIAGPTAVGKTDISIQLAKKINGEIISSDSMQIYKHFNIGTAKVTAEEMDGVPHYMVDNINPFEDFSVSEYAKMAKEYIEDIFSRGKVPIIVGGTGLYINALMYDMDFANADKNTEIRKELEYKLENMGNKYLYEELKKVDPESAERIHMNNGRRIVRALEVYYSTGENISDFKNDPIKTKDYDFELFVLNRDRTHLYERINLRVDIMIKEGLLEEVKALMDMGLSLDTPAMRAIGYKEVYAYLNGDADYDSMLSALKQNSRRYAKRQLTWFRRYDFVKWLDVEKSSKDEIVESIINQYRE
jgi:tRNA dimethylallyltransferase